MDISDTERLALKQNLLFCSAKGSFNWAGSFEDLKALVNKLDILHTQSKWLSSGGDCKLYDAKEVTIRWYSTKGTLTLKGEKADEVRSKLLLLIGEEKTANLENGGDKDLISNSLRNSVEITEPITEEANELIALKKTIDKISKTMDAKLDALTQEVHNLKTEKFNSLADEINELKHRDICATGDVLKSEIDRLKQENSSLVERNINLLCIVSDLNSKIKDLEKDKMSLTTAIKRLQVDQEVHEDGQNLKSKLKHSTLKLNACITPPTIIINDTINDIDEDKPESPKSKHNIKQHNERVLVQSNGTKMPVSTVSTSNTSKSLNDRYRYILTQRRILINLQKTILPS